MTVVLLVVFAVSCVVISVVFGRLACPRGWTTSPVFLFVLGSILFVNVGFIVLFLQYPSQDWAMQALLCTSIGLLLVSMSGFVVSLLAAKGRKASASDCIEEIPYSVALGSASFIFGIVILYFLLLGYIPLIEGVKTLLSTGFRPGLMNTFRVSRNVYITESARYIPLQGFFQQMRYFGLPMVFIWFYYFYQRRVQRKSSLLIMFLSVLLAVASGQRWPLMYLLVSLIVTLSWIEPDRQSHIKKMRAVFIISVCLGIILTALLGRTLRQNMSVLQMVAFGFQDLFDRLLVGNAVIPFLSYRLFPETYGWLYGWSWIQSLLSYLPGPYPSYPVTFYQAVTGDPTGFTAPPDFFTESYLNFGWFGVVFTSVLWGGVLALLEHWWLCVRRKNLLGLSVFAVLVTVCAFSGMSGVVFLVGCVLVIVVISGVTKIHLTFVGRNGRRVRYFRPHGVS